MSSSSIVVLFFLFIFLLCVYFFLVFSWFWFRTWSLGMLFWCFFYCYYSIPWSENQSYVFFSCVHSTHFKIEIEEPICIKSCSCFRTFTGIDSFLFFFCELMSDRTAIDAKNQNFFIGFLQCFSFCVCIYLFWHWLNATKTANNSSKYSQKITVMWNVSWDKSVSNRSNLQSILFDFGFSFWESERCCVLWTQFTFIQIWCVLILCVSWI